MDLLEISEIKPDKSVSNIDAAQMMLADFDEEASTIDLVKRTSQSSLKVLRGKRRGEEISPEVKIEEGSDICSGSSKESNELRQANQAQKLED